MIIAALCRSVSYPIYKECLLGAGVGGGVVGGGWVQNDHDKLSVWESEWNMKFNLSKCQFVQVTEYRSPASILYKSIAGR